MINNCTRTPGDMGGAGPQKTDAGETILQEMASFKTLNLFYFEANKNTQLS